MNKARVKEELVPTALHPTSLQDWFMEEDEKKRINPLVPGVH